MGHPFADPEFNALLAQIRQPLDFMGERAEAIEKVIFAYLADLQQTEDRPHPGEFARRTDYLKTNIDNRRHARFTLTETFVLDLLPVGTQDYMKNVPLMNISLSGMGVRVRPERKMAGYRHIFFHLYSAVETVTFNGLAYFVHEHTFGEHKMVGLMFAEDYTELYQSLEPHFLEEV